jgi:prepilin-type N-terminal cleavage/methylation domain-containing protein
MVKKGFTLVELLVVIVIIASLAAMLVSSLNRSKGQGQRVICLNNLKQINQGVQMYAADHHDLLFSATSGAGQYFPVDWTSYVLRLRNYVGLKGDPSPGDRLLACPCDDFCFDFPNNGRPLLVQRSIHFLSNWNWTSYCFDAGNAVCLRCG